ncbi:YgjV family protein [Celerinatantimonas sp. YJH-8]|uniref:YgjV family protein n=1 Tax=Celerinatantimonas sp. YJH-8 TaxID=3228714 RepID=UPI0038C71875
MLEHFLGHFWGQLFGFISFALGIASFCQTNDKKLKLLMVILNISNTIHYALFGAVTSLISSILSTCRTSLSVKTQSAYAAWGFILIGIVLGIYCSHRWLDMLPILGMSIGTYALFRLQGIAMRTAFLIGSSCWLANNIVVGSMGGTLLELMMISINLVTMFRIFRAQQQQVSC